MIQITGEERNVLRRELAREVYDALDDLTNSAAVGRVDRRESDLRRRADVGMWLLDDLGWAPVDSRETYYLTLATDRLAWWLRRIRDETENCLRDAAVALSDPFAAWGRGTTTAEVAETAALTRELCDYDLDLVRVCGRLLGELDRIADGDEHRA